MIENGNLEKTEMAQQRCRTVMIHPSRFERYVNGFQIAGIYLHQVVSEKNGRDRKKKKERKGYKAKLPMPLEEKKRCENRKHTVFCYSYESKHENLQPAESGAPEKTINQKRQNNGDLSAI